jgi:heme exporter protein D
LAIAGKRVRFSGLYTLWAINAAVLLMINWMAIWGLTAVKRWTVSEVALQSLSAVMQYFTCSTFRVLLTGDDDSIDLPALYQQRRRLIFGAFLALAAIALFQNWWDRDNMKGMGPNDWIAEDLTVLPMVVAVILAGWARQTWLQWVAAVAMFGLNLVLGLTFAMPGA